MQLLVVLGIRLICVGCINGRSETVLNAGKSYNIVTLLSVIYSRVNARSVQKVRGLLLKCHFPLSE